MPHPEQVIPDVGLWNGGRLYRENFPGRIGQFAEQAAALVTQVMTSVGIPLYPGDRVTTITFMTGPTAGATMTNQWAALYTPGGVLMSQSADGTSAAIAANTPLTYALSTNGGSQLIQTEGIYYAALMVKATTVPGLMCQSSGTLNMADVILTGQAIRAQSSGSALTTTAPGTIASPTTSFKVPYVVLS